METLGFDKLLSYGAIGLGCILAVLAYFLLRDEQKQARPRKTIFTSIYVFMGFTLTLSLLGFGAELWKDSGARDAKEASGEVAKLEKEIGEKDKTIADLRTKVDEVKVQLDQVEEKLSSSRLVLESLMEQKVGKVKRLEELQPGTAAYSALIEEIQKDLTRIDAGIMTAIAK